MKGIPVDFDRARLGVSDKASFERNLARLRRSFEKLWPEAVRPALEDCWKALLSGYEKGAAS